jgi:hypothetical protein
VGVLTATPGRTLRATAALAMAGFLVHQARYAFVPDGQGEVGHAYLHAIAPVVLALLVTLALGRSLVGVAGPRGVTAAPASPLRRWLASSAALLVLHVAQEGGERALAGGGPLDPGVLLVIPLCLAAGALVALTLRQADALLASAAPGARAPRPAFAAPLSVFPPAAPALLRAPALGGHLAGRAPPALG